MRARRPGLAWLDRIPWGIAILATLTFGLSPFVPEPHVWLKLRLLARGGVVKAADAIDLLLHAAPWAVLAAKVVRGVRRRGCSDPRRGANQTSRRPAPPLAAEAAAGLVSCRTAGHSSA